MKFLIVQTAFPGDVILATSVVEKLHQHFPAAEIDFLLRKGNENILENNPSLNEVIVWNKKQNKFSNLFRIISVVRKKKYDYLINLHRFASSGIITAFSGAKVKIGFDKNPFSFLFTKKYMHEIGNGKHETERNHELIRDLTDTIPAKPKLYPSEKDFITAKQLQTANCLPIAIGMPTYFCLAPASVWFTKQLPKEKWIELIQLLPDQTTVFLVGSKRDYSLCDDIKSTIDNRQSTIVNVAGQLSFLESAALMKNAKMNYVNDSSPMHIASAMNAPVTAVYCSTVPGFGFGPLSDHSRIVETQIHLDCRPCGLHGYKACPLGHFKCAWSIDLKEWNIGILDG